MILPKADDMTLKVVINISTKVMRCFLLSYLIGGKKGQKLKNLCVTTPSPLN